MSVSYVVRFVLPILELTVWTPQYWGRTHGVDPTVLGYSMDPGLPGSSVVLELELGPCAYTASTLTALSPCLSSL